MHEHVLNSRLESDGGARTSAASALHPELDDTRLSGCFRGKKVKTVSRRNPELTSAVR